MDYIDVIITYVSLGPGVGTNNCLLSTLNSKKSIWAFINLIATSLGRRVRIHVLCFGPNFV